MLAQTLNSLPMGIVCLQETKSLCTDHVRSLNWHFYLSGDASDPHAGVGFAVPQFLHPLVHDFIPVTSRIAILQLSTKPRPISLFSVYAPSQLADAQEDSDRKNIFWRSLDTWYTQFSSHSYPILMGDFNARLYTNHIAGLGRHIGPVLFSTSTEADLETNNLTHMIEFLVQHDLSIISSMQPRLPSKLVTYREIADLTDDPFHPNVDNFAVLDHVLAPFNIVLFSALSIPIRPYASLGFIGIMCLLPISLALILSQSTSRQPLHNICLPPMSRNYISRRT